MAEELLKVNMFQVFWDSKFSYVVQKQIDEDLLLIYRYVTQEQLSFVLQIWLKRQYKKPIDCLGEKKNHPFVSIIVQLDHSQCSLNFIR